MVNNSVNRTASCNQPHTNIVEVGLFDYAWNPTGSLRNGAAATSNFIDLDSRCFYIRVYDEKAYANSVQSITVQWGTGHTNSVPPTNDDGAGNLRLDAVAGNAGYFLSRAVMLVTDAADRNMTHHVGPGNDTRLRRITVSDAHPLVSQVYVAYTPHGAGVPVTCNANVFDHANGNAMSRKRLHVHLVNVRDAEINGNPILTNVRSNAIKASLQATYARCGIFAEVDEFPIDPPNSCVNWRTLGYQANSSQGYPVRDPSVFLSEENATEAQRPMPNMPVVTPSQSERDLIAVVRNRPGYNNNHIYVLFVNALYEPPGAPGGALSEGAGGEAFPDSQADTRYTNARGFAFIALNGVTDLATVHEITHITTDVNNIADGHYDLGPANAIAPEGKARRNLMHRFVLAQNNNHEDPKRLWDNDEQNNLWNPGFVNRSQVSIIRNSRFVLAY